MKNVFFKLFNLLVIICLASCSSDEKTEDPGIPTVLRGHVSDNIRGINISGYKIRLVKSSSGCVNWICGTTLTEVATVYTDSNGDYSIPFNYKLNEGESYGMEEQYYGTPYYPEYFPTSPITAGLTNVFNINAWKPTNLTLNVQVLNNINGPLMIRNEIDNSTIAFLNTENIYEQNITKTYYLKSKPDTDIKIIFWYYTGTNPVKTLHQKTFLYHTTLGETDTLDFTIDCSTF